MSGFWGVAVFWLGLGLIVCVCVVVVIVWCSYASLAFCFVGCCGPGWFGF